MVHSSTYVHTAQGEHQSKTKRIWELTKGLFWAVTFQLRLKGEQTSAWSEGQGKECRGPGLVVGMGDVHKGREVGRGPLRQSHAQAFGLRSRAEVSH